MNTRGLGQIAAGGCLALVVWLASVTGLLVHPEWLFYHALFELRGPLPATGPIVLVTIDEPSLEDLGVWPVSRTLYAELVDGLFAAGATVIGIDVTFPQASSQPGADATLAAALQRHSDRVVLAANFQPMPGAKEDSRQLVLPLARFRTAAAVGIVDLPFDSDGGIHRFVPHHPGVDPDEPSRIVDWPAFDWQVARRHAPASLVALPGAAADAPLINFAGPPGTFRSVSLIAALEAIREHNTRLLGIFRGQAVLIGATSLRLQDQYPTPFSALALGGGSASYMPGVEIHANIVRTLLAGDPIRRVPPEAFAALLAVLGVAGRWLFARITPWWGLAAAAGLALALAGLAIGLFTGANHWLDLAAPGLLIGLLYVEAVIGHFVRAESIRRFYRRTFESYVAPEIVHKLLLNPGMTPKLGGERREVTVLFSDIRNFTTISEQRSPEAVVEFLNAYLTAMAEVILANGGCIDKYIGDAILAVWGNVEPLPKAEAAASAVRAALAMTRRVNELQPIWQAQGYPHIAIGIGVNTGDAVVGNIGSPRKLEFAVIGDSINLASRLEGLTKSYGGAMLISEYTRELLGDRFACTYLDEVKVKGREAAVKIYRVDGEN